MNDILLWETWQNLLNHFVWNQLIAENVSVDLQYIPYFFFAFCGCITSSEWIHVIHFLMDHMCSI